jgi:hypothetical protein
MKVVDSEILDDIDTLQRLNDVGTAAHAEVHHFAPQGSQCIDPRAHCLSERHGDFPVTTVHLMAHVLIHGPLGSADSSAPEEMEDAMSHPGLIPTT